MTIFIKIIVKIEIPFTFFHIILSYFPTSNPNHKFLATSWYQRDIHFLIKFISYSLTNFSCFGSEIDGACKSEQWAQSSQSITLLMMSLADFWRLAHFQGSIFTQNITFITICHYQVVSYNVQATELVVYSFDVRPSSFTKNILTPCSIEVNS